MEMFIQTSEAFSLGRISAIPPGTGITPGLQAQEPHLPTVLQRSTWSVVFIQRRGFWEHGDNLSMERVGRLVHGPSLLSVSCSQYIPAHPLFSPTNSTEFRAVLFPFLSERSPHWHATPASASHDDRIARFTAAY